VSALLGMSLAAALAGRSAPIPSRDRGTKKKSKRSTTGMSARAPKKTGIAATTT